MPIIKIKKSEQTSVLAAAMREAGSTEWAVYANLDGDVDLRHNTYPEGDWIKIIDCYGLKYENDEKYPGDDGYDYQAVAEWLVDEACVLPDEPVEIGLDSDEGEFIYAYFEITEE